MSAPLSPPIEKLLGLLAADEDDARVELVQVASPGQPPTLELRYQRECGALGWTTHKRIKLAPGQFSALRDALNLMDMDARQAQAPAAQVAVPSHLRLIG